MADDQITSLDDIEASDDSSQADSQLEDAAQWKSWSNLWQIPTILISTILIVSGLAVGLKNRPGFDYEASLHFTEMLIADNQLDLALTHLREVIEPRLELASETHRARFNAIVGDWIYFSQTDQRQRTFTNNQRISDQYAKAEDMGMLLEPPRIERWAESLIRLGQLDQARDHLAQLDAIDLTEGGPDNPVRERRNRIFRMLIEHSLHAPGTDVSDMLALLKEYQNDERLSWSDRAWAMSKRAAIRLEAGETRLAIDHLLVDMRRLEQAAPPDSDSQFGELYTLFGRGYYDLGLYEVAQNHLAQAIQRLGIDQPAFGDAQVLLGKIAFAKTDYDEAYERFDQVVNKYISTPSYLPGLLGRADVSSVLGDHDASQADFRLLREKLVLEPPRIDINEVRIAESLRDRHDAALASRQLELALTYTLIAEGFFKPSDVPASILLRIASTSRALGDQVLETDPADNGISSGNDVNLDLEIRRQANRHYKMAGEYHIRHARSMAMRPEADQQWADSLWRGADAFDMGGWYELSIAHFKEYLGARSTNDSRRAEVLFRLGRAHHAQLDYEKAAAAYEEVIANHPRSQFASSTYVPLAHCYLALDRASEAEEHLLQVVAGQRFLDPQATDFRNALLELGNLYHDTEQFGKAIETLHEAVNRYPDNPRRIEMLFQLADSYRGHAMQLVQQLDALQRLAPKERERLDRLRREHLQLGIQYYAAVCEGALSGVKAVRSRLEADLQRRGFLYQADCLFHLDDFEAAITLYDFTSRKYSLHHSSMYALVQIVNCFSNLGQIDRAQTAHRRALVRLEQLPPDTFSAADSLMTRDAWERWLENSPVAPGRTASALP